MALESLEEALRIQRQLAADLLEIHEPGLSLFLEEVLYRLAALGRQEEALVASQEAVELRQALAKPEEQRSDLNSNLTSMLSPLPGRHKEVCKLWSTRRGHSDLPTAYS